MPQSRSRTRNETARIASDPATVRWRSWPRSKVTAASPATSRRPCTGGLSVP
ncbi:hypothetical protein [Paracoccus sediminilitoris]|uniref:hypothetical protein n=1 Tax=Paracoccus sediminilitoris TaxID=2202419 RepID=UPI0013143D39|nr:hypothetical protein [Paracoccus sediminilitoris]